MCLDHRMASTSGLVHPKPRDHLTALPSELQHLIFGYVFPTHEPDKAFELETTYYEKRGPASHPLDYLAATCRSLRGEVMEWSLHFLMRHHNITKYKPLKTVKLQARRNLLRGRGGLLTWAEKNCVFCGKPSSRSAILVNSLRCCVACDKEQWPDKITRSDAKKQFDLKDHHLLPHHHHSPSAAKLLAKHPGGLPKLRYGTYMSSNVATTMFLKKDVEALAILAHGDLKAHLTKRQADREERSRKLKGTKERKQAEAAHLRTPQGFADYLEANVYGYIVNRTTPPVILPGDDQMENLAAETESWLEESGMFGGEGEFQGGVWVSSLS